MKNSNVNDENLDKMAADKIPDVVLVKKVYAEKALRNRKRKWKLKFLNEELHREKGSVTSQGGDFGDFLDGKLNLLGMILVKRRHFCWEMTTFLPEMKISEKYASGQ